MTFSWHIISKQSADTQQAAALNASCHLKDYLIEVVETTGEGEEKKKQSLQHPHTFIPLTLSLYLTEEKMRRRGKGKRLRYILIPFRSITQSLYLYPVVSVHLYTFHTVLSVHLFGATVSYVGAGLNFSENHRPEPLVTAELAEWAEVRPNMVF